MVTIPTGLSGTLSKPIYAGNQEIWYPAKIQKCIPPAKIKLPWTGVQYDLLEYSAQYRDVVRLHESNYQIISDAVLNGKFV
jgi:hypothetical protein